jgi:hypothetical protein
MGTFAAPSTSAVGDAGRTGVSSGWSAEDHQHPREQFGSAVAANQGAGTPGVATTVTRSDHNHGDGYSAWTSLTLLGPSNTTQGTPPFQFRTAPGGEVELRGQFSWTGAYVSGTAIATFPAGALPYAAIQTGVRWSGTGSANTIVNIDASGNLSVASSTPSSGSILSLDGFSFVHA